MRSQSQLLKGLFTGSTSILPLDKISSMGPRGKAGDDVATLVVAYYEVYTRVSYLSISIADIVLVLS